MNVNFEFIITSLQGPYAIIMAPTRELAQQIEEECIKFGKTNFQMKSYWNWRVHKIRIRQKSRVFKG